MMVGTLGSSVKFLECSAKGKVLEELKVNIKDAYQLMAQEAMPVPVEEIQFNRYKYGSTLKRRDFIRHLTDEGCYLKRHGSRHDIYANIQNGKQAPVPRHREIKESLCKLIKQQLGITS